jgi:P27 family predicted phage terminase small subunit
MRRVKSIPVREEHPPPDEFDEMESEEWNRVVEEMDRRGILGKADRSMIESYCQSITLARRLLQQVKSEGFMVQGKFGPMMHPAIGARNAVLAQTVRQAKELGITVTSRGQAKQRAKGRKLRDLG